MTKRNEEKSLAYKDRKVYADKVLDAAATGAAMGAVMGTSAGRGRAKRGSRKNIERNVYTKGYRSVPKGPVGMGESPQHKAGQEAVREYRKKTAAAKGQVRQSMADRGRPGPTKRRADLEGKQVMRHKKYLRKIKPPKET